jgi:hypothetical protein
MSQSEVQTTLQTSLNDLKAQYWMTTDPNIQSQIATIRQHLQDIQDNLNQGEIKSRTDQFKAVSISFNTIAIPAIQKLSDEIQNDIAKYETLKTVVKTLGDIESATGFFQVPSL